MFKKTFSEFGYLYILLYCLANAISFVFISHINKTHNDLLNIVMIFSYATLLFNFINVKKLDNLYGAVKKNYALIFFMNVATLFNWIGSFFSLNYIDPATALCINLSMGPITTFFILTPFKKIKENGHLIFAIILIILGMILITKQHTTAPVYHGTSNVLLGVMFSVIGGIAGGFVGICSQKITLSGFSLSQVLATRFYLLVTVCAILLFFYGKVSVADIDWKFYLLSSLLIVIFPLVMYQAAIKSLGPMIVSIFIPFAPILAYFLQVLVGGYPFNLITILLLIMISASVIWLARLRQGLTVIKRVEEKP
jgi:drug/metabolite transporter (DMT)-like permease